MFRVNPVSTRFRLPTSAAPPRPLLEPLEQRRLLANVTFAVVGDYGFDGQPEADVANRIKSWNPGFVTTTGDNNYPNGEAATIDKNIGKHYRQFIYPYKGTYGPGALDQVNHFFPSLGNHDWVAPNAQPYHDYFTLPGNERYYTVVQGPVQLFILDSDPKDPALQYVNASTSTANSTMGQWLKNALATSTAPWKLVVAHHAPYSSSAFHGNSAYMQWPYQQWGAHAVLTGHDHHYERIVKNNLPYFVNGTGGAPVRNQFKATPESGSAVRFGADYGAMKVDASDTLITFRFITRAGQTIDTYTLDKTKPPPPPTGLPAAPTGLTASSVSSTEIRLAWSDNANNESGYKIERSNDGANFYPLAGTGVNGTSNRNTNLTPGRRYYYRVYAWNSAGNSARSNVASAVAGSSGTPAGVPAAPTLLGVVPSTSVAHTLNLTWRDNSANESGFKIERSTDGKTFYAVAGAGASSTFQRDSNLTAGRRYYYRIYAWNSAGRSAYSSIISAIAP